MEVRKYQMVAVFEGNSEDDAEPVVVSDDPAILTAVRSAIASRIGGSDRPAATQQAQANGQEPRP